MGGGLLPIAVRQSPDWQADTPLSGASPLPHVLPLFQGTQTPTLGLAFVCRGYITAVSCDQSLDVDLNRPVRHGACPMARPRPVSGLGAFSALAWPGAWCWHCRLGDRMLEHRDRRHHGCCDHRLARHHDRLGVGCVAHVRLPGAMARLGDARLRCAVDVRYAPR